MVFPFLLLILQLTSFTYAANILAILPTPSYSHQIAFAHIWKELSLRGHKVTTITTDPVKDKKLINLTEIDMHWTYSEFNATNVEIQKQFTMWTIHSICAPTYYHVSELHLTYPEVQNLIKNSTRFDIVLVEFLFPEFLAFAEIYNCPKIIFSSMDANALVHSAIGNPINPALFPDLGDSVYQPLKFKERVLSTLYTWYCMYFYFFHFFGGRNKLIRRYFNITKTVDELMSDVDMLLINVNPILQPIRAVGPLTIAIGGNRQDVSSKLLPQDIIQFLDSAQDGFIYFSLGSNVKSKNLDEDSMNAIIETFKELPYKVLWKFEADEFYNKPENVKLIKWAPQQAILSHPNIKLFVTQGGLQSMEEALYHEVPFVVIPFIGDQESNADMMKSKGIAVVVPKHPSIRKTELKTAILEVANNPKYKIAVTRLKHLTQDFPMTGTKKAIWWIEYVIRHKGTKHLRNPAADIPFYQYYLLDVISFLILVVIALLTLSYFVIRIIFRRIKLFTFSDKANLNCRKTK